MILSISFPFDNLPDIIFELIKRVQEEGGMAIIHSTDFSDPGKLQACQRWIYRMLSSHRSTEQVQKIYSKLQWQDVVPHFH